VVRKKILHYHQLYINRSDPVVFIPLAVDTSDLIYDDFNRLLFLHDHRETSVLANEIIVPERSGQSRFLRTVCLTNIKGSVGLILTKVSVMRISIRLDLSFRPFIPLPCFIRSRHPTTLLAPSLVFPPLCFDLVEHERVLFKNFKGDRNRGQRCGEMTGHRGHIARHKRVDTEGTTV
jgi:hypothetical protein